MELCFVSNLSSSEWAAWVQAIGSLLAVGVATYLGYKQWRQNQEKKEAQKVLVVNWAEEISELFRSAYVVGLGQNIPVLNRVGLQLDDLTRWSTSFTVDTFDAETMKAFIKIRSSAHEFSAWSRNVEKLRHQEGAVFAKTIYQQMARALRIFGIKQPVWTQGDPEEVVSGTVI